MMITYSLDVITVYALQNHGNMNTNRVISITKNEKKKHLIILSPSQMSFQSEYKGFVNLLWFLLASSEAVTS